MIIGQAVVRLTADAKGFAASVQKQLDTAFAGGDEQSAKAGEEAGNALKEGYAKGVEGTAAVVGEQNEKIVASTVDAQAIISDSSDKFIASQDEIAESSKRTADVVEDSSAREKESAEGFSLGAVAGYALVGGVVAELGVRSIEAADKFETAQVRLDGAIKNTGGNVDAYNTKLQAVDLRLAAYGDTSSQVADALAPLVVATKSAGAAFDLSGLAANIAAGRNIDLSAATNILVKVETGHVSSLGRLGIATKDAAGKTITAKEAIQELSKYYAGDAAAASDTFAGKQEALKAQLEDLEIELGQKLEPVFDKFITLLLEGISAAERHAAALKQIVEVVAPLGAAFIIATKSAELFEGAMAALDIELDANPVGAVVLALEGLIAIFVVAYKRSATFREEVNGDFDQVKAKVESVYNSALKPIFADIARGFQDLIQWGETHRQDFVTAWDDIEKAITSAWVTYVEPVVKDLEQAFHTLTTAVNDHRDQFRNAWTQIQQVLSKAWTSVLKPLLQDLGKELLLAGVAVKAVADMVAEHWPQISAVISKEWAVVKPILLLLFTAIHDILVVVGDVITYFTNHFGDIAKPISAAVTVATTLLKPLLDSLGAVSTAIGAITGSNGLKGIANSPTAQKLLAEVHAEANANAGPTIALPAKAAGGPVTAGGMYLVGERGPEILQMGGGSGTIIPNHAIGGSDPVMAQLLGEIAAYLSSIDTTGKAQLSRMQRTGPGKSGPSYG